ncbi:methyltransferase [Actinomadura sp. WMMB 499]|uniref:methyltransferase n=1 Tax=Actinomadura sp. WMMB 499 TaxID=1219491 RepID=UPI00124873AA|nr:methyltransferase [Actinomadura sp. WMMB 499]QFG22426.1 methyltransferase [Actinomadura sp. WMMB 499]
MTAPDVHALLDAHPWIESARPDATGGTVRVRPAPSALAVRPAPGALVEEFLDHWGEVYDWTYGKAEARHADDLDLSGWRASGTGEPFPPDHMREWVAHTVGLILAHRPRHVLELGCGTGLLTHRLHGRVAGYVGTDVAEAAVERLDAAAIPSTAFVRAAAHRPDAPRVRAAMERLGFPGGRADFVVLNSVTQCFPNVPYLEAVLRAAVASVAPGGAVLVGDVRDARLLPAFCRWIEEAAAPDAAPDELDRRAAERAGREAEFLFDPPLLAGLAARIGAETGRRIRLSVHPKTMRADTELTRYRFDAVLRVDAPDSPEPDLVNWDDLPGDRAAALAARLGRGPARVRGVPFAPLSDRPGAVTAAGLRDAAGPDAAIVADPHDPASLAVVSPAGSAAAPVEEIAPDPATAHEPFAAFVDRRLTEVARTVLRRAGAQSTIVIDLPGTTGTDATDADGADTDATDATNTDATGTDATGTDGAGTDGAGTDGTDTGRAGTGLPLRAAEVAGAVGTDGAELTAFLRRLDEVALMAMCAALRPAASALGNGFTAHDLGDRLRVADRHRWILRRWLAALVDAGHLSRTARDGYGWLLHVTRGQVATAGRALAEQGERAGYPAETTAFILSALARLPELLRDEVQVQQLLFGGDGATAADGAYRENGVNRYLNAGVGEVLRWAARERARGGPLRVLEAGAGVGGTTAEALDALSGAEIDYLFTDVSRYFLNLGRERFGDRAGVRFAAFDINAEPEGQGVDTGSLDVVLSANVLHNARHAPRMLAGLGRLLAPGGLLVFVETVRELPSILASMQFLMSAAPGAERLAPGDPRAAEERVFLRAAEWEELMGRAGLRPWFRLPAGDHPLADAGLHLFVARREPR